MKVFVNGRFAAQPLTGVQRYAREAVRALGQLVDARGGPAIEVVSPAGRRWSSGPAGHFWDQFLFPIRARRGFVLGLGNVGSVWIQRQVVVLHDAGIYDVPTSYRPSYRLAHRLIHRLLVTRGAAVATVSEFSRERLSVALRLKPEDIVVTGVGSEHITRYAADAGILSRLRIRPKEYVLAVASRAPHKNLEVLECAASALAAQGLRVVLVGGTAASFAAGAPGLQRTTLTGPVKDAELRALYEHALALVFPSLYEGFGLPVVEAMRLACPVVIAAVRPLVELFGEAALAFPPHDAKLLVDLVGSLRSDAGLATDLAERGRKLVTQWTWTNVAAALLRTLPGVHNAVEVPRPRVYETSPEVRSHG